ncbi:ATP-dependent helicase/nuclease subunit A [Melaminivora alkalimesophila]|uniref:DNA 3'-5' helicase n=2 Tax=Melaminivora alkalimesophila TaxID=1165852 RepID=A0A317RG38_9BURK|nr:UvrD-helicase domain-containing protein [Melaminivora alkalimesophila]PWW49038.1 ATP-dependent helicase/nuclease subunit A [Melaminivora alkalimesophila]
MSEAAYEHNGRPVSREAFYAIACDPARSVAVEACAGAGKTWMLVSRILRALLEGSAPHEILAITFTKKAAGEMRQRLQELLQEFAQREPQTLVAELVARGMDAQQARERSARLQGLYLQVLAAGRQVQIRTFHSWFAALLSTAPLSVLQALGLPARYQLLEEDDQAVAQVWRPFQHAVAQDEALRADYQACIAAHGRHQTHKALEAALDKRIEFTLADQAGVVDASVLPFGKAFAALAGLGAPCEALRGEAASARWHARARALAAEKNKTPRKAAQSVVDAFLMEDLEQRLTSLRNTFFVATEDRLTAHLQAYAAAQEAEAELQELCAARQQHAAWLHQQRMARLARRLIECYAQLKRERGWVDMNDVERTALVLLADPVLSGWVHERLDARVRHLLIDEFQDTNPLQWQALHAWLSGYAGAGGGVAAPSVFIVGDPKQSIYRFRRAEPQVFRAAQDFVRQALGGDLLACDHTRRNAGAVIGCVNAVMQAAQEEGGYRGFRVHTTESKIPGRLERLPAVAREGAPGDHAGGAAAAAEDEAPRWRDSLSEARHDAEETPRMRECAQAAQWVARQLAGGRRAHEILVLARTHDRLAAMQEALRALHVPCVRPERQQLADMPEVQDVLALLDALVSPGHDLSLARALKSPLFGLDDAALVQLALRRREWEAAQEGEGATIGWLELLLQGEGLPAPLQQAGRDLARYRDWVAALPPHDALQAIYTHADVLARYAAAAPAPQRRSVLVHLRALLAAALQEGGGRFLTPYAFVRAMRRGGPRTPGQADGGAVRLLTIHGAKGLEADCVLLLDTDAPPKRAETMGILVDWPGESALPRHFVFLASESRPPPGVRGLLDRERQARQHEEFNLLYVAMTRARECLALSCVPARTEQPGSWWGRVSPHLQEILPEGAPAPEAAAAAITLAQLPPYEPPATEPAVQADAACEDSLASRQGEAMHQLLEQAGAGAPQGWSAARLARLAHDFDLPVQAAAQAAEAAQRILRGEGAWAWDARQVELAMNEVPLVWQGQGLRIDRVVRRRPGAGMPAGWWVLDYKSALAPERQPQLLAQLRRYREALAALLPGEAVRAAFLTGDGRMVCVDAADGGRPASAPPAGAPPATRLEEPQGSLF